MAKYNHNFFQVPHVGLSNTMEGGGQAYRDLNMKMSNFGALNYGLRSALDYTKTQKGFSDKIENPAIPSFLQEAERNENPLVWGQTRKFVRNDELKIMTLGSRDMDGFSQPRFDVTDTNLSSSTPDDGSMPLNWPAEGFRHWGGRTGGPFNYQVSK
jgi:hypothetical protein